MPPIRHLHLQIFLKERPVVRPLLRQINVFPGPLGVVDRLKIFGMIWPAVSTGFPGSVRNVKICFSENNMIESLVQEAAEYVDHGQIDKLRHAGSGMFKLVYWLPSNMGVIKIINTETYPEEDDKIRRARSFDFEKAIYIIAKRHGLDDFFPATVWGMSEKYGPYMVQEACHVEGGFTMEVEDFIAQFGLYDIHSSNVGVTMAEERSVILDWGYDEEHPHESPAAQILDSLDRGVKIEDMEIEVKEAA